MSKKQIFYAVKRGRITGIFHSWNECRNQVDKFSGAEFKKFSTNEEATNYLKETIPVPKTTRLNQVFADGGSRKNPGIAGCGACLLIKGLEVSSAYRFLSLNMSNNQAEYHGLLLGLELAQRHQLEQIEVSMDSHRW